MNAVLNGINQPEELLNISTDALKLPDIKPTAAKKSHMLLMSLLLAAEQSTSRFQLISILLDSLFKRNAYKDSSEELTPFKVDWVSVFPVFFIFLTLLICPGLSKKISGSTVNNYALQYPAIMKIIARYSAPV
jgi:hypothetical protein